MLRLHGRPDTVGGGAGDERDSGNLAQPSGAPPPHGEIQGVHNYQNDAERPDGLLIAGRPYCAENDEVDFDFGGVDQVFPAGEIVCDSVREVQLEAPPTVACNASGGSIRQESDTIVHENYRVVGRRNRPARRPNLPTHCTRGRGTDDANLAGGRGSCGEPSGGAVGSRGSLKWALARSGTLMPAGGACGGGEPSRGGGSQRGNSGDDMAVDTLGVSKEAAESRNNKTHHHPEREVAVSGRRKGRNKSHSPVQREIRERERERGSKQYQTHHDEAEYDDDGPSVRESCTHQVGHETDDAWFDF